MIELSNCVDIYRKKKHYKTSLSATNRDIDHCFVVGGSKAN